MILQVRHALPISDCRRLVEIFDASVHLATTLDYSGFPALYATDPIAPADREFMSDIVSRCRAQIAAGLGLPLACLHPETIVLTALGIGGQHPRHADNAKLVEGRWVPNHTPRRSTSSLLYLNDDFEGGALVFDQQDVEIRPESGLLVAFPSSGEYPHTVRPVTRGRRLSMPVWFTNDPALPSC